VRGKSRVIPTNPANSLTGPFPMAPPPRSRRLARWSGQSYRWKFASGGFAGDSKSINHHQLRSISPTTGALPQRTFWELVLAASGTGCASRFQPAGVHLADRRFYTSSPHPVLRKKPSVFGQQGFTPSWFRPCRPQLGTTWAAVRHREWSIPIGRSCGART